MEPENVNLCFSTFRLAFRAERPLVLPLAKRGDLFRGAFGDSLRRLVCYDLALDCRACLLRHGCPYPAVFEPRALVERTGWKDPPPPFVLRPLPGPERLERGEEMTVELVLVGGALGRLPYLVAALRGAGAVRGPAHGKLLLERLAEDRRELWRAGTSTVHAPGPPAEWPAAFASERAPPRVRVEFVAPTELVHEKRTVGEPEMHHLVRRAADRAEALAWAHGGGSLGVDRAALAERARSVRRTAGELRWVRAERRSARTGQVQFLSGVVGWAEYEGDLAEAWPYLRLAERIHVGKDVAFGKGQIRLTPLW